MNTDWTRWALTTTILSMTLAASSPAFAADGQQPASLQFTDYSKISPDKVQAIQEAVNQGLLSGFPDGQFRPKATLTRQELAVLLTKALHLLPETTASSSFADVGGGWAAPYIEAVSKAGLMTGDSANAFRPDAPMTREEMATVFVRAVGGAGAKAESSAALDVGGSTSSWASDAVQTSVRMGLVVPTTNGFQPKATVQREDIAAFLVDIFKKEERTSVINKIDGDFVTIDGRTMLIDDRLKALFAGKNKEALEGAILKYTSLNKNVDDLAELEIVSSGSADKPVSLDTTGSSFDGVLRIKGDNVSVKGESLAQVDVGQDVRNLELNAAVGEVIVQTSGSLQLTGDARITTLKVSHGQARIALGDMFLIDTVNVPESTKMANVITNYDISKDQIKNHSEDAGTNADGSTDSNPSRPPNHTPAVAAPIPTPPHAVAGSGEASMDLAGVFKDSDKDILTLSASSSDPTVATVRMAGTTFYITPLKAGISTITVKARDSRNAFVSTTFAYTVVANPVAGTTPLTPALGLAGGADVTLEAGDAFTDDDVSGLTISALSDNTNVATVSVTGTTVSLKPLASGTATITLTATDADGLTAQRTFSFRVNAAPSAGTTPILPAVGLAGGSDVTVDLSSAFTDDQASGLTFDAQSGNTTVAAAAMTGTTLHLTPLASGTAAITVTVTDADGATASRTFSFRVNAAPAVSTTPITPAAGTAGGADVTVDVSGAFTDDNASGLTINAESDDTSVVTVSVAGMTVSLKPLASGTATITLTATDADGATAQRTFSFTVNPAAPVNQPPAASVAPITPAAGTAGGTEVTVDLSGTFTDDNGGLTYSVVSGTPGVASATVLGSTLHLLPLTAGTTTITLTATDSGNLTAQRTFTFTVNAPGVIPVDGELKPDVFLDANPYAGEIQINTSESTYRYDKRNIKNLLKLTRGANTLSNVSYDSVHNDFNVYDGDDQVADIEVTSDSADLTVGAGSTFVTLSPGNGLSEQSTVNLTFHVKTIGGGTDDVVLPVTVDKTAPTVTNRVVAADFSTFSYTFSEKLVTRWSTGSDSAPPIMSTIYYTPTGGSEITLNKNTDYNLIFAEDSNSVQIALTPAGLLKAPFDNGGQFMIAFTDLADYAYNTPATDMISVPAQNNGGGSGIAGE